jgi:hypothetical protein
MLSPHHSAQHTPFFLALATAHRVLPGPPNVLRPAWLPAHLPCYLATCLLAFVPACSVDEQKSLAAAESSAPASVIPAHLRRQAPLLDHPIFNMHHSETQMMRYLAKLEKKDLALNYGMISLGACVCVCKHAVAMAGTLAEGCSAQPALHGTRVAVSSFPQSRGGTSALFRTNAPVLSPLA